MAPSRRVPLNISGSAFHLFLSIYLPCFLSSSNSVFIFILSIKASPPRNQIYIPKIPEVRADVCLTMRSSRSDAEDRWKRTRTYSRFISVSRALYVRIEMFSFLTHPMIRKWLRNTYSERYYLIEENFI